MSRYTPEERQKILDKMSEEFMVPDIEELTLTTWERKGETTVSEESPGEGWEAAETRTGIYARLSAPGYLDCTEWAGPFYTQAAAEEYLVETYGDSVDLEESEGEDA